MDISALALKLILLLVPGGIATLIFEKLTTYQKWSPFKFIVNSIFFGGACYILSDALFYIFLKDEIKEFWKTFVVATSIPFFEIFRATAVSISIGFLAALIENKKWITRFARLLTIADKYGEENLYSYFLNDPKVTEVYVRDIINNLTFHGEVDSFSETEEISEISLRDVKVYDYQSSNLLYTMPRVFLSRPKNTIFIEVPI
jgi:hypothetical protein